MLYQSAIYLKLIWFAENGPEFLRLIICVGLWTALWG
jgi:hypothetical protein